ncbi:2,4-dienoyl-CoA reductase [Arboricoccus pini]|uniref:2,4-dienoyl-CoA reductase n=1 Tax=Arboricoccus pini TaxID=1963835 RepID=A0A212RAI0_9PROT|nr:NADH:flavin oxidoreductase/NADH oxidase [Arboricoccus pini]SNB69025.1 2,4-dienoyl-CoA reductase [Arboricoccus pini]
MTKLFEPLSLRGTQLVNRIAVAPMCQYVADEGTMTSWHLMHLGQFACGGSGLVIVEATGVSPEARITHGCVGLWSDANEEGMRPVLEFARTYGTAKMGIQLGHAGRKASVRTPLEGGGPLPAKEGAWQTVGPSALAYAPDWHVPTALDAAGLARIRQDYEAAARRAVRLGFELIEIHMAHGYLLHQFLSPISNQREDGYGGALEGRMRFPLEIFEAVRAVVPDHLPVGVRVSATDWVEGGWDCPQTVEFAKVLDTKGCDFIDVSSGGNSPLQRIQVGLGYQLPFARAIKAAVQMKVMAVGMIIDGPQAEAILRDGDADMIALARAAMDDPHWAWHAARALGVVIPYPPQYARAHPDVWDPWKKRA